MNELFFAQVEGDRAALTDNEYHHAVRVTRHQLGDELWITDFKGKIWSASLIDINPQAAELKINAVVKEEICQEKVSIAISPTQTSERTEWFVEKAVECGVHHIYFLQCKRTEVSRVNMAKMNKVMWGAAKQCHRAWLPALFDMQSFRQFVEKCALEQKFICHCSTLPARFIGKLFEPNRDAVICIGPAGDFTDEEIKWAEQFGFAAASLGEFRLRTETAGIAALQIWQTVKNLK